MNNQIERDKLISFLIDAKRHTYAAGGEESKAIVTPLLPGSHQLEYRNGSFFYRDIYFGEAYFVGQETIYYELKPIWSMCYGGGFTANVNDKDESGLIGKVLQSALREIPQEIPFRGPKIFEQGDYKYLNRVEGNLDRCSGDETIERDEKIKYQLKYIGGMLL